MDRYLAHINGKVLADNIIFADNFMRRLIGLLKHKKLKDGEGLLLNKCRQIHTFGMKFAIDIIYLSDNGRILHTECNLQPGKVSKYLKNAAMVVELKAGTVNAHNIICGEDIAFKAV